MGDILWRSDGRDILAESNWDSQLRSSSWFDKQFSSFFNCLMKSSQTFKQKTNMEVNTSILIKIAYYLQWNITTFMMEIAWEKLQKPCESGIVNWIVKCLIFRMIYEKDFLLCFQKVLFLLVVKRGISKHSTLLQKKETTFFPAQKSWP